VVDPVAHNFSAVIGNIISIMARPRLSHKKLTCLSVEMSVPGKSTNSSQFVENSSRLTSAVDWPKSSVILPLFELGFRF